MSAWTDFQRNVQRMVHGDPAQEFTDKEIIDRMQFPIGRNAVDMSKVSRNNIGILPKDGIAGYSPFMDHVKATPLLDQKNGPHSLAHEFRHRDNRWSDSIRPRQHEKITVLDMLESQNGDELAQARAYNDYLSNPGTNSFNKMEPVKKGDSLINYLRDQKPWLVKESIQAARDQGIPLAEGETYESKYNALADKLINRTMTNKQTWPMDLHQVEDPAFKRYLINKADIGARRVEAKQRQVQPAGPGFSEALDRVGPTRARHNWNVLGEWSSK
jgi:hypothetical protein